MKNNKNYVDGFVLSVPKKNLKIYRAMAKVGAKMWKKYGALEYKECIADDMSKKWSMPLSKMAKTKPAEVTSSPTLSINLVPIAIALMPK